MFCADLLAARNKNNYQENCSGVLSYRTEKEKESFSFLKLYGGNFLPDNYRVLFSDKLTEARGGRAAFQVEITFSFCPWKFRFK